MTVWAQAALTATKRICSLYNQALKIMDKKTVGYHHCHILKKHNFLSFESFSDSCFLKLTFKCINNLAPEPLRRFVEETFQSLKERLISAPVLGYLDYTLPFVLQTDASGAGLGAVLAQVQDGAKRVIAYASRGLSPAEA